MRQSTSDRMFVLANKKNFQRVRSKLKKEILRVIDDLDLSSDEAAEEILTHVKEHLIES